jgi:membrane protease YdiL (CAAX protease family)
VDDGGDVSDLLPPRPDLPPPPGGGAWIDADAPPKATWRWWEIMLVGLGALLLGTAPAVAVYLAFHESPTSTGRLDGVDFLANGLGQIAALLILVGYLAWRHPGWRRMVRLPRLRDLPRELGIGAALGIAATFALAILVAFVLEPLFRAVVDHDVTPAEQVGTGITGWEAVAFVLAVVVVAPVVEEFFFRGLFYRTLRDRYGFWVGALGSAALFALLHSGAGDLAANVMLQIAIGTFGVGLAAMYEWRGTLGANIAAHAAFNLVTVLTVLKVV